MTWVSNHGLPDFTVNFTVYSLSLVHISEDIDQLDEHLATK